MNKLILLIFVILVSCHQNHNASVDLNNDSYKVGFLITDGVYNTELTAPYDIFHHTKFRSGVKPMEVFTVSNQSLPITSFEGLKITPDYNFNIDKIPNIDILVIPSAEHHLDGDLENNELLNWIRNTALKANFVTSHCDGAFMLAKAGLLENIVSTTFPSDIPLYKEMFPHLDVRDSVLFVHDGKYITSAGGAKSFEAALYLTEHLYGDSISRELAKGLVIDWNLNLVPHVVIPQSEANE